MVYTPKSWLRSTPFLLADFNHMQEQYAEIMAHLESHDHDDRYYPKAEMDSFFWSTENDGSGSDLNADLLQGTEGADIESGVTPGIIGFWYGTLADFTGKLLTGYPNWHIADGSDGSEDLIDQFPIGASAIGSGYQKGEAHGSATFKPVGSIIIASHILTIAEIMHTHPIYDEYWPKGSTRPDPDVSGGSAKGATITDSSAITSSVGGGEPHDHTGTFIGDITDLLPPFISLIPVQYGNYSGNWTP